MKLRKLTVFCLPLLVLTLGAGLCFGSVPISLTQLLTDDTYALIFWQLRLPRVLAAVLAGVGLSTAGVLLQTVTANDLASPNIIGINSGAGLAVILLLTAVPTAGKLLPVGAFCGAFAAALVILLAADRLGGARAGFLLMGIALTTLCNAVISFLSLLDEGVLAEYNHFSVGSLKGVALADLLLPGILIFTSWLCALAISSRLAVLCMGDAAAAALGIRVKGLRLLALALAAASASAVVSFAGLLGFVGLVVPHIAKGLVGQQPGKQLWACALLGAIIVVLADLLGRTLFAPSELPVGILMSLIGGPYFLILICRRKPYAYSA